MSYFKNYPETRMDNVHEQYFGEFFAMNPQMGENGQVISNLSFIDVNSYPKNNLEVDEFHKPQKNQMGSSITHSDMPTSQQESETFLSVATENAECIGFTKLVTSPSILFNANFEESLNFNEDHAMNISSFYSPVENQVGDQFGEIFPKESDYQQLSSSLQTPTHRNAQYQIYSNNSAYSLTSPDYNDQTFPPLSWWDHDSSFLAISEEMAKKKTSNNSSECCLKTILSSESVKNNKDESSMTLNNKSKQFRHYSSVADISSAYQRKKQLNRHKMGQYRSVSPCLQIRKRRSAKGLKAAAELCGSSIGKRDATGFVNYTPEDSEEILTGVAPSGSNKTKARREREALEKRQKLSQAALRAVEAVGGDISGLVEEEFFFQN
ncbi:putative developmental regulatory protein [Erysiphe neolycopersici]|uniref:Putative developmental regulatory protein n=1 Tax=Erysiphe neolycopersici TaxID=212602 RepID=A0A420I365_9PEZI|nr:putative developmental regulatory protein [Erysiphe neolycopersici]